MTRFLPFLLLLALPLAAPGQANYANPYTFATLAGQALIAGSSDGTGSGALFDYPDGLALDSAGNLYIVDQYNFTIRQMTPSGTVTTLAGLARVSGSTDGTGNAARFNNPWGLAMDNAGNLYVADQGNQTMRKVSPEGGNWVVTTMAGKAGVAGSSDGTNGTARFNEPDGVAVDQQGNVYVADHANHTIRRLMPVGTNWVVTTVAGKAGTSGSADGTNSTARFNKPTGVAADSAGNLYVADIDNNTIRMITPAGTNWVVTTLAGKAGVSGSTDGTNGAARFYEPNGVIVDNAGNLYVTDYGNNTIREMMPVGTNWVVTTLGGLAGSSGSTDGTGSIARFHQATFMALDNAGDLYVSDRDNDIIRRGFPANGLVRTWQSGLALYYTDAINTMPYRLYLPVNYNSATNYPLVLFLHGSGESGTDNVLQVENHIAGLIARTYSNYPAILVAPQNDGSGWDPSNPADLTLGILAQVRSNYAVDDRRIYLTGLSMGGFGTTDYAYDFPTMFAAIAPMSGADDFTPDAVTEFQLSQLPTWLFHGSADPTASVTYSRDYYMLVTGLANITFTQSNYGYPTAVSGPIRYTEFTGLGHDIWELIYGAATTDFYDWMFSQTRPPATFTFATASANGGTFVFGGSNSVPFATGYLLTSTNLQIPASQWPCIATNWCDANGNLMFTNNFDTNANQRFYILKLP